MSNFTPATAIVVTAVPYSVTVDVSSSTTPSTDVPTCADPNYPAWWQYTPALGVTAVGLRVDTLNHAAAYVPSVSVWTGTPGALTQLAGVCMNLGPASFQVKVTPGTAYYVLVTDDSGTGAPTTFLKFFVDAAPLATAPRGSLMVSNDTPNFPAAFLNATTGATLAIVGLPSFEQAEMLPAGKVLVAVEPVTSANVVSAYTIYDAATLAIRATNTASVLPSTSAVAPLTSNRTDTWYVVRNTTGAPISTPPTVITLDATATQGPTTWALPYFTLSHRGVTAAALGSDGITLVYTSEDPAVQGQIATFNLLTNSAGADLLAPAATTYTGRDLLRLSNTSYLVTYFNGAAWQVRNYSTAGALTHTFAVGTTVGSAPRIALALDDPLSFWLMSFPTAAVGATPGTSRFRRIVISSGAAAVDVTVNQKAAAVTPTPEFGPAQSCPLMVWPVVFTPSAPAPTPPDLGTVTRAIRFVRQMPHLWDNTNNHRLKYPGFQLITDAGTVRADNAAPLTFTLQWSDDQGHTWSNLHPIEGARQGQHAYRFWWRRLGQSRDRVFRILSTDDAPIVLVDALLTPDPIEGSS